jgi:hypothetical protein
VIAGRTCGESLGISIVGRRPKGSPAHRFHQPDQHAESLFLWHKQEQRSDNESQALRIAYFWIKSAGVVGKDIRSSCTIITPSEWNSHAVSLDHVEQVFLSDPTSLLEIGMTRERPREIFLDRLLVGRM